MTEQVSGMIAQVNFSDDLWCDHNSQEQMAEVEINFQTTFLVISSATLPLLFRKFPLPLAVPGFLMSPFGTPLCVPRHQFATLLQSPL